MSRLAIWAQLEAKAGKEKEVEEFLKSAQPLAEREPGTMSWYAVKMGPGKYGIFDTFADENGRNAHLNGEIAKALFAKASELFAKPPEVAKAGDSGGERWTRLVVRADVSNRAFRGDRFSFALRGWFAFAAPRSRGFDSKHVGCILPPLRGRIVTVLNPVLSRSLARDSIQRSRGGSPDILHS